MSEPTRLEFRAADGAAIAAYRWDPVGNVRAIAQITHGVGEHAQRYAPLADKLANEGYVVYAHDHRGHGASLQPGANLGEIGQSGWSELVADIGGMNSVARSAYPSLPLALIAHSMGSFATQQYLLDHSPTVDAAVLSGTAALDLLEPAWTWTHRWIWQCSMRALTSDERTLIGLAETRSRSIATSPTRYVGSAWT